MSELNVFKGPRAVFEYLHPRRMAPMIELPSNLNPLHTDDVVIYAKIYDNIKMVTAFNMLERAHEKNLLKDIKFLPENTSGNTAPALQVLVGHFSAGKVVVPIVPQDLATGKAQTLQRLGLKSRTHNNDGVSMAAELGEQEGWLNLNQYANPHNPEASYRWIAPQIYEQTEGKIRIFASAVGTSGTLGGNSQFFREKLGPDKFTSVGVLCQEGKQNAVPGVRSRSRMEEIKLDWKSFGDHFMEVDRYSSYFTSQRLANNGIPAGPSSGLAYRGLLDFLFQEKEGRGLEKYRGIDGKIVAVFICPDSPDKYGDKYTTILDGEDLTTSRDILR